MPNHVTTTLRLKGSKELIERINATHIKQGEGDYRYFDFNSLIRMPELLKNTASGFSTFEVDGEKVQLRSWYTDQETGENRPFTDSEQAELEKIGTDNWYDWCNKNWGTKWNAYSCELLSDDVWRFDTAWSPPTPIFDALAATYSDLVFETASFDEGWGFAIKGLGANGVYVETGVEPNAESYEAAHGEAPEHYDDEEDDEEVA